MNAKVLSLIGLVILIVGCATNPPPPRVIATPVDDTAQAKLAEAAASVSQSLVQLAAMEQAVHPGARIPGPPNPRSIGMAKLVSVNWNGPVEPLMSKIAAASNYRVRIIGRSPAIPALVSIYAQNTPLADVLRDASFQVQRKATVVLYPRSRVIEIRYLGT